MMINYFNIIIKIVGLISFVEIVMSEIAGGRTEKRGEALRNEVIRMG